MNEHLSSLLFHQKENSFRAKTREFLYFSFWSFCRMKIFVHFCILFGFFDVVKYIPKIHDWKTLLIQLKSINFEEKECKVCKKPQIDRALCSLYVYRLIKIQPLSLFEKTYFTLGKKCSENILNKLRAFRKKSTCTFVGTSPINLLPRGVPYASG